jgi:hypothetical protein
LLVGLLGLGLVELLERLTRPRGVLHPPGPRVGPRQLEVYLPVEGGDLDAELELLDRALDV